MGHIIIVSLLGKDINSTQKDTHSLLGGSKKTGPDLKAEKMKYVLMHKGLRGEWKSSMYAPLDF
jgi:hypothetical protein